MKAFLFGLLALAVVIAPAWAAPRATLSQDDALTRPASELADRALRSAAPLFVEVERPTFHGMIGPNTPLMGLRFAAAATSAGNPGLCKADTLIVDTDPIDYRSPADTRTPTAATSLRMETVYKVVADLKPLPDEWNDRYGAELERKCKGAGRVIPTESADLGQRTFFRLESTLGGGGENDAWLAARALQLAMSSAIASHPPKTTCLPGAQKRLPPECKNAGALIHALAFNDLVKAVIKPCPGRTGHYCIDGEFLRRAMGHWRSFWELHIEAELRTPEYSTREVTRIDKIVIGEGISVLD